MSRDYKKTIVILPGWDGSQQTWQSFTDYAKNQNEFDFICLELPCFGNQPCPDTVWGVKEYASYVEKELGNLKITKPIILGHSFGGQVAAYLVAHNPDLVSKLILSGAPVIRTRKTLKRFVFKLIAKIGKGIFKIPGLNNFDSKAKKFLYKLTGSQDYNETSGIKREIYNKVNREDLKELIPLIKTKTLVIWGQNDTYVPVQVARKINKLLPNAQMKIFSNAKHGLHLQIPEDYYQAIINFIKEK